jgi:pyridoxal phosphate enzyme (YggS family)
MAVDISAFKHISAELSAMGVTLVAVSKTKPAEEVLELYNLGHRDFGENYVQELVAKAAQLPKDIRWHFIGHLQSNKVKQIASFVHLIHGVDSLRLLQEINKQAGKNNRVIDCLLQVHIAEEETKFGFDENEVEELIKKITAEPLPDVRICGLMGMASFTENMETIRGEFKGLKNLYSKLQTTNFKLQTLSMGMSADYKVAVEEGSNMVRIGSLLFGERDQII